VDVYGLHGCSLDHQGRVRTINCQERRELDQLRKPLPVSHAVSLVSILWTSDQLRPHDGLMP
jgi:hypothetical protein